jgi:hypothetical protein
MKEINHTKKGFGSIINRLEPIGKLRDPVLVMAGIFYLFGYIVWAINAHNNNLGLVPALEFQYVVAGIVPVLIVLAIAFIVVGYKWLRKKLDVLFHPAVTGTKRLVRGALFILWFISLVLLYGSYSDRFYDYAKFTAIIFTLLSLLLPPIKRKSKPLRRSLADALIGMVYLFSVLGKFYGYAFVVLFPLLAFLFFVNNVYTRIPLEFGGARPRYACLDVVKIQLSSETIARLIPQDRATTVDTVARSSKVEVLFSSSEIVVVRSQGKVYEITKGAIQAVSACD